MKSSVYQKFWLRMIVLILIGLIIGIVAVETSSKIALYCFFAWTFIASYLLYKVKCPNCGTSLTYGGTKAGIPIHSGFASRNCKNCGETFV